MRSRFIKTVFVVFILLLFASRILPLLNYKQPQPSGVWKDLESDYFVVFNTDGTYVESLYNTPCSFEIRDGKLVMQNITGETTSTELERNIGGYLYVLLNGEEHTLAPTNKDPQLYQWGSTDCGTAIETYRLLADFDIDCYFKLYEDSVFSYNLGDVDVIGKYILEPSKDLLLFNNSQDFSERLVKWERGYAVSALSTDVDAEVVKKNAISESGYLLSGNVYDPVTGITYYFRKDRSVSRSSGSTTSEFMYTVDIEGLITMVDTAGSGVRSYMWYDALSNEVYRYVFEKDNWSEFLLTAGGGMNAGGQES